MFDFNRIDVFSSLVSLMIYFSPITVIVIACELLVPQTTLVSHTVLPQLEMEKAFVR